ncbi:hypothetical protein [Thiospirillum jenense]|nr:hypothetical protein [Thiospirillum jenense]
MMNHDYHSPRIAAVFNTDARAFLLASQLKTVMCLITCDEL